MLMLTVKNILSPDSLQESVWVYQQLPSLSSETTIMNRALNRQLPFYCPSRQRHIIISFFNQSSLYIVNQSFILSFIVFWHPLSVISHVTNWLKLISCYRASVFYESRPQDFDASFRGSCIKKKQKKKHFHFPEQQRLWSLGLLRWQLLCLSGKIK